MSVILLLLLLIVVVVVTTAMRTRGRGPTRTPGGDAEWPARLRQTARTTARWRVAGLGVGVLAAVVTAQQDVLGRGLMLAAPLCALCVLCGVVVGELRVSSPSGPVRNAALETRRVRDYLPPRLTAAVVTATALLGVVLTLTTAAGSADDLGRAGRSLVRQCSPVMTQGVGPWPGSFYAAPLAVVVVSGLLLAGLALRRVVHRPRSGDDAVTGDALRRQAAEAVTAGCGLLVAVPLAGVSLVAAHALLNLGCAPAWWTLPAAGLLLIAPVMAVLAAWCVAALASPTALPGRPLNPDAAR